MEDLIISLSLAAIERKLGRTANRRTTIFFIGINFPIVLPREVFVQKKVNLKWRMENQKGEVNSNERFK